MKKNLIIAGLSGVVALLVGAVVFEAATDNRTVDSWSSLMLAYCDVRKQMPPLPMQTENVLSRMEADDWSFLCDFWQIRQSGGVWYAAENSELAKLDLPLKVIVFEDIRLGEVIIMSSPLSETSFQGEALFTAPKFIDLAAFQRDEELVLSEEEQLDILFQDLSPRRVVWEITLKSESEKWSDLLSAEKALLSGESELIMMPQMMMSVPAAYSNDLWLCLEQTNGTTQLNVFAPESVTNVEVYACTDLVANVWTLAATNLHPTGATNPATWNAGNDDVRFFAAGNMRERGQSA